MKNFRITIVDNANGHRVCGSTQIVKAIDAFAAIMALLVAVGSTPTSARFTGTRNYGEYRTNGCLVRAIPTR